MSDEIINTVRVEAPIMRRELGELFDSIGIFEELPPVAEAVTPSAIPADTDKEPVTAPEFGDTAADAGASKLAMAPKMNGRRAAQVDDLDVSAALLDAYPDVHEDRIKLEVLKLSEFVLLTLTGAGKLVDIQTTDDAYSEFAQSLCEVVFYYYGFGDSKAIDMIMLFGGLAASAVGCAADVRKQLKSRAFKNELSERVADADKNLRGGAVTIDHDEVGDDDE